MQSNCGHNEMPALTEDQERMRRNLRYHFMNPKEKWQAKGTLPIKMISIIIKLIVLTIQLILFSENNSNEVSFAEGSKTSFKHLFLNKWESSFETLPYPPSSGPFAIYRTEEFYTFASYALKNYYELESQAIGPYGFGEGNKPVMNLTTYFYQIGEIYPYNSTYKFSNIVDNRSIELKPIKLPNTTGVEYDVKAYLSANNFTVNFNGLLKAVIKFNLRSIQLKSYEIDQIPDCFQFDIKIIFDNSKHNGQVIVDLLSDLTELTCHGPSPLTTTGIIIKNLLFSVDILALLFSIISFVLCCRSLIRLYKFWKKAKEFYVAEMGVDIISKWKHFFSVSYMLIFFGDILVISGTLIKLHMYISREKKDITTFNLCTYFLGIGVFLGYLTLLRYFSYFPKSSILINTIRAAAPPLIRFSLCSIILYLAFSLLGWIILGPHHLKFRTLASSVSCLFSLMNGDDMYVTLSIINSNNTAIFIFSQLFIYLFCILFIFVVLNLILTIIIEAYNQVQNQDPTSTNMDMFWHFINSCPESSKSPLYRSDLIYDKSLRKQRGANFSRKFVDTFCCCIGKGGHTVEIHSENEENDHEEQLHSDFYRTHECINGRREEINPHLLNTTYGTMANYGSMYRERKPSPNIREISIKSQDIREYGSM